MDSSRKAITYNINKNEKCLKLQQEQQNQIKYTEINKLHGCLSIEKLHTVLYAVLYIYIYGTICGIIYIYIYIYI